MNAAPSANVTPGRTWKVLTNPFSEISHDSANPGTIVSPSGADSTSEPEDPSLRESSDDTPEVHSGGGDETEAKNKQAKDGQQRERSEQTLSVSRSVEDVIGQSEDECEPLTGETALEDEHEDKPAEGPSEDESEGELAEVSSDDGPDQTEPTPVLDVEVVTEIDEPDSRRLFANRFSVVGVVCIGVTILLLIGTIILLNWDTVVKGEDEEIVGSRQFNAIFITLVGVVVFVILTVIDAYRSKTASRG